MCRTTPFQNPATARTAGSCERTGATKAPVLSPAIFSTGRFTLDLGVEACSGSSCGLPHTGPTRATNLLRWGTDACPPPLARHNGSQGQTGGFSALRETAVLFVNGVVIPVFSKSAFLLSVLRHPGRLKWVRASARNCGWRIAGRDACPTRGWVKLFLRPVAANGRRWQSALQGGGCWFIQLYF